jgi:hypothetical protein
MGGPSGGLPGGFLFQEPFLDFFVEVLALGDCIWQWHCSTIYIFTIFMLIENMRTFFETGVGKLAEPCGPRAAVCPPLL